jgi:nicotinamide mononucleotide adenylyltransferase
MIVIFNGPPGSGKDEAAAFYKENFGFGNLSFKYQLFKETINHFEVDEQWFMEGYDDRTTKEKQEVALNDMSRREAMIYVSEDILKPKKGLDYFGRTVAEEIEDGNHYAIADGGFVEELQPLVERVGAENIVIVQLTREGHDYSTDSRRYFNGRLRKTFTINESTEIESQYVLPEELNILTYRIHNNGIIRNFHDVLNNIFEELSEQYVIEETRGNTDSQCDKSS